LLWGGTYPRPDQDRNVRASCARIADLMLAVEDPGFVAAYPRDGWIFADIGLHGESGPYRWTPDLLRAPMREVRGNPDNALEGALAWVRATGAGTGAGG